MSDEVCKRSMDCKCKECKAANEAFSVDDLKQFSSKIDYGAGETMEFDNESIPKSKPPAKPAPKKPTATSRSTKPARPLPTQSDEIKHNSSETVGAGEDRPIHGGASKENVIVDREMKPSANAQSMQDEGENANETEKQNTVAVTTSSSHLPLPTPEELTSKDWKVRKIAYEALTSAFNSAPRGSDVFTTFGSYLKKMVGDTNAVCVDIALEAAQAYAENFPGAPGNSSWNSTVESVGPEIITKGFSAARGVTCQKAEAALLKFMEVDTPEAICLALLKGLSDKKPKVVPACVQCLVKAAEYFGGTNLPLKEIRSQLKSILEHKDTAVRSAGVALVVELFKWIGRAPLQGAIDDMRSAQQAEIEAAVKDIVVGQAKPTVYLRKLRPAARAPGSDSTVGQGGGGADSGAGENNTAFDPRDLIEAVDLNERLRKTEFKTKIALDKWNEKVEAIKIASDIIGDIPKLVPGDYGELVRTLKGLCEHSHVQVACSAMKLLGCLSQGLLNDFRPYCTIAFKAVFNKLSDKKCIKVCGDTLEILYGKPLTMESVIEEVLVGLDPQKVNAAHARIAILTWVQYCTNKPDPIPQPILSQLIEASIKLLADSDSGIRTHALDTTAVIIKRAPGLTNKLNDVKITNARAFKKIMEQVGSASDTASESTVQSTTNNPPPMAAASKPASKPPGGVTKSKAPSGGAKASEGGAKPKLARKMSAQPGAGKATASNTGDDDDNDSSAAFGIEEALAKCEEMNIHDWTSVLAGLQSAKWQDKKASLESLASTLTSMSAQGESPSPHAHMFTCIIIILEEYTKSFKDSNVNVLKGAVDCVGALVQTASSPSSADKGGIGRVLTATLDKIADRKLKDSVFTLLTACSEVFGPNFTLKRVVKLTSGFKAPQAHVEVLNWINQAIQEFGASAMPVSVLCTFAATELDNGNPKVRTSAIEVLGSLYKHLGPPLKTLLPADYKAKSAVETEFEKVGYDASLQAQVTRKVRSDPNSAGGTALTAGGGIPRADLLALIPKDCITRLNSTDGKDSWKGRKAAIEEIHAACGTSGHYIDASKGMGEVIKGLRARLNDSQSNLKPLAANAIAEIMISLTEENSIRYIKGFSEGLFQCVADNKKLMRDAALSSLDKIVTRGGDVSSTSTVVPVFEAFIPFLCAAMNNIVGRTELLGWCAKHLPNLHNHELGSQMVDPLLACLQDKAATARQAAEECLIALVAGGNASIQKVKAGTRDLTPAASLALKPALARIYATIPSGNNHAEEGSEDGSVGNVLLRKASSVSSMTSSIASNVQPPPPPPPVHDNKQQMGAGSRPPSRTGRSGSIKAPPRAGPPDGSSIGGGLGETFGSSNPAASKLTTEEVNVAPPLSRNTAKPKRAEQEKRSRWIVNSDEPRDQQIDLLRAQWRPFLSLSAVAVLFPSKTGSMECGMDGCTLLSDELLVRQDAFLDSLDLVFKWITIRLVEKENVQAFAKLLELLCNILKMVDSRQLQLEDYEADVLLPTVFDKTGQSKERFRVSIREVLELSCKVCPSSKYSSLALLSASSTKNNKSKVVCLEEVARILDVHGLSALGKKGLRDLSAFLEAREPDVRTAALDGLSNVYVKFEYDIARMLKNIGPISDKAKALLEDRAKSMDKKKTNPLGATLSSTGTLGNAPSESTSETPRKGGSKSGKLLRPPSQSSVKGFLELEVEKDPDVEVSVRRASLTLGELQMGAETFPASELRLGPVGGDKHGSDSDDMDGPFKFNDSALEVNLSPNTQKQNPILTKPHTTSEHRHTPPPLGIVNTNISTPSSHNNTLEKSNTRHGSPRGLGGVSKGSRGGPAILEILDRLFVLKLPIQSTEVEYTQAKEQIKNLYSLATNKESGSTAERQVLLQNTGPLIGRLIKCLELAFFCAPGLIPLDLSSTTVRGGGGMDLPLLSTTLAALMAIVREFPTYLDIPILTGILDITCGRLIDERFNTTQTAQGGEGMGAYAEYAPQMVRALNKLAIAAVDVVDQTTTLAALLGLLAESHPEDSMLASSLPPDASSTLNYYSASVNHSQGFSMKKARIFTKLLSRVITREKETRQPFSSLKVATLVPLFDKFFINHPAASSSPNPNPNHTENANMGASPSTSAGIQPSIMAVRSLWFDVCEYRGVKEMNRVLKECGVSPLSPLTLLLRSIEEAAGCAPPSKELKLQLFRLIDRVSKAAGDKKIIEESIEGLYQFAMDNPEVSLEIELNDHPALSQSFKNFILKQLQQRMDSHTRTQSPSSSQTPGQKQSQTSTSTTSSGIKSFPAHLNIPVTGAVHTSTNTSTARFAYSNPTSQTSPGGKRNVSSNVNTSTNSNASVQDQTQRLQYLKDKLRLRTPGHTETYCTHTNAPPVNVSTNANTSMSTSSSIGTSMGNGGTTNPNAAHAGTRPSVESIRNVLNRVGQSSHTNSTSIGSGVHTNTGIPHASANGSKPTLSMNVGGQGDKNASSTGVAGGDVPARAASSSSVAPADRPSSSVTTLQQRLAAVRRTQQQNGR